MKVTLKYIVKAENCADGELEAFLARAVRSGAPELIVDIDYDFPEPAPEIVAALARLKHRALRAGLHARYGFTGDNFAKEHQVAARVQSAFQAEQLAAVAAFLVRRRYAVAECVDLTVENLVRDLDYYAAHGDREVAVRQQEIDRLAREAEQLGAELGRARAALAQMERPARLARLLLGALRRKLTFRRARA